MLANRQASLLKEGAIVYSLSKINLKDKEKKGKRIKGSQRKSRKAQISQKPIRVSAVVNLINLVAFLWLCKHD